MVRQGQHGVIHNVEHIRYHAEIFFAVFSGQISFGILDRPFQRGQSGRLVNALKCAVAFNDAFRRVRMRPQRNPVPRIKPVAHGVIKVIMRIQRALHGDLAHHPECIHLKGSAHRAAEPFDHQRAFLSHQEAPIAKGLKTLRRI